MSDSLVTLKGIRQGRRWVDIALRIIGFVALLLLLIFCMVRLLGDHFFGKNAELILVVVFGLTLLIIIASTVVLTVLDCFSNTQVTLELGPGGIRYIERRRKPVEVSWRSIVNISVQYIKSESRIFVRLRLTNSCTLSIRVEHKTAKEAEMICKELTDCIMDHSSCGFDVPVFPTNAN